MFKTLQFYITLIAQENELFSVSTVRQISSSSDAETFRRPACWRSVNCQQKGRTHHSLSISKLQADMFDSRPSTSRDETAIGQLKIGVLLHDVTCGGTQPVFISFQTLQNFVPILI